MIWLLASLAHATEIVIAMAGGSIIVGTQPALTGTTINSGVTYYISNVATTTWPHPNTGMQDGLADCLVGDGYTLTIFQRAVANTDANLLVTTRIPNLIADAANRGKTPDVLVIATGGTDSQSIAGTQQVAIRQFGPLQATGPQSADNSVVAQMRAAWGADTPLVLAPPSWFNGLDLTAGLPESDNHYYWVESMGHMLVGCAHDPSCWPVIVTPESVPADTDQHPTGQGYYDLGTMVCHQIENALFGL